MTPTRCQAALADFHTSSDSETHGLDGNQSTPGSPPVSRDIIKINDTPSRSRSSTRASDAAPEVSTRRKDSKQARNARKPNWKAWQDRALAEQALIHRPFLEARGAPIQEAWDRLAEELCCESLRRGATIDRSGAACRARFKVLIDAHRKNEVRPLHLTGTDEEVNEHIMTLTNILVLINDHEIEREQQSSAAKTRVAPEIAAALESRDAAMRGIVECETLTDVADLDGSTLREHQGQRSSKKRARSSDSSDKKNQDERSQKRHGTNLLFDILASCSESDTHALEQARARDEERQLQLVDRLDRMADGIAALTEITKQRLEQDKDQQSDMLKMILNAVLKK